MVSIGNRPVASHSPRVPDWPDRCASIRWNISHLCLDTYPILVTTPSTLSCSETNFQQTSTSNFFIHRIFKSDNSLSDFLPKNSIKAWWMGTTNRILNSGNHLMNIIVNWLLFGGRQHCGRLFITSF
uniref:Uncharacterized protein n=1 Tax=Spongospora subterranea TaxID=70186 RepID=A0A0H5R3T8_9EUKA|eukprot:CRZ08522.1 hypothetical protein [Spongospora subterranea]